MDAKELFYNIRDIRGEIILLEQDEEYTRLSMLPGAIQYDKDKVKNSPSDPMGKFAEKISEYDERRQKWLKQLHELSDDAEKILEAMPTAKYRRVLRLRHMQGGLKYRYSWSEVANNMHYEENYVRKELHPEALAEAQEIYEKIKDPLIPPTHM